MRCQSIVVATLLLAACGTTPTPIAGPTRPIAAEPPERGGLIGLETGTLLARFGEPRLRVREGDGTKLQFGGANCLLDAYLYPSGGVPRVTHVDARTRDGRPIDQARCIAMIEAR